MKLRGPGASRAPFGAACLALFSAIGCAEPTQLVVVVSTDMTVPTEVDQVRVRVFQVGDDVPTYDNTHPIEAASPSTAPYRAILSFGAGPRNEDTTRRVRVLVDAFQAGRYLFSTEVRTGFARRKRLRLDVYLARRCLTQAASCTPDETCGLSGCTSPDVPVETLPPYTGDVPAVGVDPRDRDGGVRDAGAASALPRLVRPLSLATATTQRPTLTFAALPTADEHVLRLTPARPGGPLAVMESIPGTFAATAAWQPTTDLPPGAYHWSVEARQAGVSVGHSATWELFVPGYSSRDAAWGVVPDVNGDGLGDVVAASQSHMEVLLSPIAASTVVAILRPLGARGPIEDLAAVGDVDGDGYGDVAIVRSAPPGVRAALDVFLGGSDGLSEARTRSADFDTPLGPIAVAAAGDFDGDGYGDIVVSTPGDAGGVGHALVFLGGATVLTAGATFDVPVTSGTGAGVASIGPIDSNVRDGFGAMAAGNGFFVYSSASATAPISVFPITPSLGLVAAAGDYQRNGRLTAIASVTAGSSRQVMLVTQASGSVTFMTTGSAWVGAATDAFAASMASAGDVDGDGLIDVVIGRPNAAGGGSFDVERTMLGHVSFVETASPAGIGVGASVALVGDVDGDGLDDIAVGAPASSGGAGRIYVLRAYRPTLDVVLLKDSGEPGAIQFGFAIASR